MSVTPAGEGVKVTKSTSAGVNARQQIHPRLPSSGRSQATACGRLLTLAKDRKRPRLCENVLMA